MREDHRVFPRLLRQRAKEDPERTFVQEIAGTSMTYGELNEAVLVWADAYRRLGVLPGETVATMLPNSINALCAWLGLSWLPALEVPINTDYRGHMLHYILANSKAAALVVAERYVDRIQDLGAELPDLRAIVVPDATGRLPDLPWRTLSGGQFLAGARPPRDLEGPHPHTVSSVIYTSGTTGPSKGVLVPWRQHYANSLGAFPFEDLSQDDAFYVPFPAFHVSGKVPLYLACLVNGRIVLREAFRTSDFWNDIRQYGCTTTMLVGAMTSFVYTQEPRPDDIQNPLLNVIMVPLPPYVADFKRRFGVRICTQYGMTEVSAPVRTAGWDTDNWRSCGRVRQGYPGYEVRIVDDHDEELGPGRAGELICRTNVPWTMNVGYFRMPERTAEAWRNGWFHTGDALLYDENGDFRFVDRVKDAIRRRGENISSFEVEAGVNEHPDIVESAAVPVPSEHGENEVKVCVVLRPGSTLEPEQLVQFLIPRMPRFMIPRYVEFFDALPKTETLRIRKVVLRENALNDRTWDREAAGIAIPR